MKVIVAGSRDFTNYPILKNSLDKVLVNKLPDVNIVSGTARGADQLGERYASERSLKVDKFPANWDAYGKRAGYLRNEQMAIHADALIAFWDGKSRGTKHMIDLARKHKLIVRVFDYSGKIIGN